MLRNLYYGPRPSVIKGQCAGGVAVRGITRPLKEVFYPHHRVVRRRRGNSSAAIGTRVHKEVEDLTNGNEVKRKHRYTVQIEHYLAKNSLYPVASEAPILSFKGRYLTHADLICVFVRPVDGVKEIVVISLKTGYNNGIKNSKNFCRGDPCRRLPNSYATHHALQLACEVHTMRYEYHIAVSRAYILYVGFGPQKKTAVATLPAWGTDKVFMDKVHAALKKTYPRPDLWPALRKKMADYVAPEMSEAEEEDLLGTDIHDLYAHDHDQAETTPSSPPFEAPDEYIGDAHVHGRASGAEERAIVATIPITHARHSRELPPAVRNTKRVYVGQDALTRILFEVYETDTHYAVCSNMVQRLTHLPKDMMASETDTMADFASRIAQEQPNGTHFAFYWCLLRGTITHETEVIDLEPAREALTS